LKVDDQFNCTLIKFLKSTLIGVMCKNNYVMGAVVSH